MVGNGPDDDERQAPSHEEGVRQPSGTPRSGGFFVAAAAPRSQTVQQSPVGQVPTPQRRDAKMPPWITFVDCVVLILLVPLMLVWGSLGFHLLTVLVTVAWLWLVLKWFDGYRRTVAPPDALAREDEQQRRAEKARHDRQWARSQVRDARATKKMVEKEAYAPPRLLDVAILTDAGPACPGCGGVRFVPYRSGARRAAIGGATLVTGALGGAAAWAIAGKNMIECVTCQATFRPGATDPHLLERMRKTYASEEAKPQSSSHEPATDHAASPQPNPTPPPLPPEPTGPPPPPTS